MYDFTISMFTPSFTPRGEQSSLKKNVGVNRGSSPLRDNFTTRGQANFTP
jgi:hypothetical protein